MADDLAGLAAREDAAVPDVLAEAAVLAAAEGWAREALNGPVPSHLVTLLAEYDRRELEIERLLDWVAELERLRRERAEYDLDARIVGAVPRLLAMCTKAEETAVAATAVDGLDRIPAWLTTPEVRSAIAAAVPGGLTAELEQLRARVAELEAEHERVQDFHRDRLTGSLAGSPARMWAEQLGDAIAGRYVPDQVGKVRTEWGVRPPGDDLRDPGGITPQSEQSARRDAAKYATHGAVVVTRQNCEPSPWVEVPS